MESPAKAGVGVSPSHLLPLVAWAQLLHSHHLASLGLWGNKGEALTPSATPAEIRLVSSHPAKACCGAVVVS